MGKNHTPITACVRSRFVCVDTATVPVRQTLNVFIILISHICMFQFTEYKYKDVYSQDDLILLSLSKADCVSLMLYGQNNVLGISSWKNPPTHMSV